MAGGVFFGCGAGGGEGGKRRIKMLYYGIKDKKTGQLLYRHYLRNRQNTKQSKSILSFNYVSDALCSHIFLMKDKNAVMSILRGGYYEYNNETYEFNEPDGAKYDLELYETEFNL
jgi:hypothetical protein